jgi:predicted transcriptional regulator
MPPGEMARSLDEIRSKREQQVMEVVRRRGKATAADVYEELPDASSYNAVRGVLSILEEKGHLWHEREGRRFVYRPVVPVDRAGRTALTRVMRIFFGGSRAEVLNTLFEAGAPTAEELDELQRLIDQAHEDGNRTGR